MEKNVNCDLYLTLNKKGLSKTKVEANKDAIAEFGDEDGENELRYADSNINSEEVYFDKSSKTLELCGNFVSRGEDLGYLSLSIPLGNDTIIEIIEHRMKQLGKLKTVMEALKD